MEFNSCAKLLDDKKISDCEKFYDSLLSKGVDPLDYMFNMQYDLQEALVLKGVQNNDPGKLDTLGMKYDWLRDNKIALDDEFREVIDALPGMKTPEKERSALWKKWKAKYNEIRSKTFDDLSDDELTELKFEYVDMFHFFMNMAFALNISARELFTYYYYKNAENFRRCKEGY